MATVEKVALVTGGAQGIGRGIALALAGQGWKIAVADRQIADSKRSSDFFFVRTDVASERAVRAGVRAVVRRFGRLDALVNNAGLADPRAGPVEKLALREWNRPPRRARCNRSPTTSLTARARAA